MQNIEVKILNPTAVADAEKMMVAMARLTQRGEKLTHMEDLDALLNKGYTQDLVRNMAALPHPTIQKFGIINIGIVGASRRFLAQITRHQNEVKFMSGSLQYSDWSSKAQFCVPYELISEDAESGNNMSEIYLADCLEALEAYKKFCIMGRDAAGYLMPQGMRNILLISATPYQWKHMISQRICRRNTLETRYVMLLCWEQLIKLSPMFENCGPSCMSEDFEYKCNEGKMSCGNSMCLYSTPKEILDEDFKYIRGGE